jgi:hypothetical protein
MREVREVTTWLEYLLLLDKAVADGFLHFCIIFQATGFSSSLNK